MPNGLAPPGKLPDFPDRLEVLVGDRPLTSIDANLVANGAFDHVHFNYYPSRPKLQASNTIEIPAFKDRAGNPGAPVMSSFTWP